MDDRDAEIVRAVFGADTDEVLGLLDTYGEEPWHREPDRVRRAILKLSGGDMAKLRHNVDRAKSDYRDVLYFAEYPPDPSEPGTYDELRRWISAPPERNV